MWRALRVPLMAALLAAGASVPGLAEEADSQQWSSLLLRRDSPGGAVGFSAEYQVRLKDDLTSLKGHFFELAAYHQATARIEFIGGYRFTIRPDHKENRLLAGAFLRHGFGKGQTESDGRLRVTHHVLYQRDFNASFNDILLDSTSLRYVLLVSRSLNRTLTPFVVAAALYTWNDEYTGLEKLRFAAGVTIKTHGNDRLKLHYVYEKKASVDPPQFANVLWLKYEVIF